MKTYVRDLTLLGSGLGLFGPMAPLGVMAIGIVPVESAGVMSAVAVVSGGLLGLPAGLLLGTLATAAKDYPLRIAWAGFPVGALCGGLVGTTITALLGVPDQAWSMIVPPAVVLGGLTLGFFWLPYLALRHRDRSALPLVVLTSIAAFPIGIACLAALAVLGF